MSALTLASLRRADPVWVVALAAIAVASLWAIIHLGARAFWLDELYTAVLASPSMPGADAWTIISGDVHPPLYYLGVRAWSGLFGGATEVAARSFNLVAFGLAAAGAVWAARLQVEAPVKIWFALFFTSFGALWYVQEARMYAFLICDAFLVCIVALAYEKLRDRSPSAFFIAATIVTFVILPFTHWFAGLFAGLVLFGLFVIAALERRLAYAAVFFGAGVGLGAVAAAWIFLNWSSTAGAVEDYSSGAGLELWQLRLGAVGTLLFAFTLNPVLMLAAGWAALGVARRPLDRPVLLLLLTCAAAVPVLILAASLISPVNQTRNFVGFVAPATLAAAIGLAAAAKHFNLTPVRAASGLAAVLALSLLLGLSADRLYPMLERDQWREAGAFVRSQPGCESERIPISQYWNRRPAVEPGGISTTKLIYAYYAGAPERFVPVYSDDRSLPDWAGRGTCPVALWLGHTPEDEAVRRGAELLGPRRGDFMLVYFAGNGLFVRNGTPAPEHQDVKILIN